jgi:hypothetical protein
MVVRSWGVADFGEAMRWYRKAADQRDAFVQKELSLYHHGRDVAQDYGEAMRWYRMAADQGRLSANNVGWLYENGWGVAQDYSGRCAGTVRPPTEYLARTKSGGSTITAGV